MITVGQGSKSRCLSPFLFYAHLLCTLVLVAPVQAQEEPLVVAQDLKTEATAQSLTGAKGAFEALLMDAEKIPLVAQTPPPAADPAEATEEDNEPLDLLDEIVSTASRRRATERDLTQTTTIVSRQDIQASGARTVSDALKLVPGVTFIDTLGGINSEASTFIRGLDSRRFIFLIDGRPTARAADNRAADVGRTAVNNIERIEVVTGGAALRFSADAVAGLINVITATPEGPPKLKVSVNFGSYGYSQYLLEYSGSNVDTTKTTEEVEAAKKKVGYTSYQLAYERRSALNNYSGPFYQANPGGGFAFIGGIPEGVDLFDRNPETLLFDPASVTLNVNFDASYTFNDTYQGKLVFRPWERSKITLTATQVNSKLGDQFALLNRNGTCFITPPEFNTPLEYRDGSDPPATATCRYYTQVNEDTIFNPKGDQEQSDTAASVTWDWELSELNTLTTQFNYSSSFFRYPSSPGTQYVSGRVIDVQTRYQAQLFAGNTLNTGFQFTSLRYNATPFIGAAGSVLPEDSLITTIFYDVVDRETNRWAIFVTDDLELFDKALILNIGSRLTNDLDYGTFTTSGVGFRFNFGGEKGQETFGLRGNWSQTFKTPGLSQRFGYGQSSFALGGFTYFRNENLRPETAAGYDLGLDIQLSKDFLFRATYYRTDIKDALQDDVFIDTLDLNGDNRPDQVVSSINAQQFLSTGWELSMNWKISPEWNFQGTYSIVDARPLGDLRADSFEFNGETFIPSTGVQGGYLYEYQSIDIPFYTAGISLRYGTEKTFQAALIGQFIGLRPRALGGNYFYPAYSKWDLTFRYPFNPTMVLTGGLFNFTNDRSILADGAIKLGGGIPSPPTNFRIGLELTF